MVKDKLVIEVKRWAFSGQQISYDAPHMKNGWSRVIYSARCAVLVYQDRDHPQIFGRYQVAGTIVNHNAAISRCFQQLQGTLVSQGMGLAHVIDGADVDDHIKMMAHPQGVQHSLAVRYVGVGENDFAKRNFL